MSYLSSLLSSLGAETPSTPHTSRPVPRNPLTTTTELTLAGNKRKADAELITHGIKAARKDADQRSGKSNSIVGIKENQAKSRAPERPLKHNFESHSGAKGPINLSKRTPTNGSPTVEKSRSSIQPKQIPVSSENVPTNSAAPKGSFREILARAQAAKAAQPNHGLIKHKAAPKMSKRERLAQEAEATRKRQSQPKGSKSKSSSGLGSKNGESKLATDDNNKAKKKAVDLGYKGTMRANPSSDSSIKRSGAAGASKNLKGSAGSNGRIGQQGSRYTYASYSDEEDEDDEEDYESDMSDDMEAAGFNELEEEEEFSRREARKEDDQAQEELDSLKQQKLERQRKLQQLAAGKRR